MGFGSSKEKKPEEKTEQNTVTAKELQNLLEVSIKKCTLYQNKLNFSINQKKDAIATCLKQNNIDLAKAKMDNILKDENFITIYDLIKPVLASLKEKCQLIIINKECPTELRSYLDTALYAAIRLEIDELKLFEEKIRLKYGLEYATKAVNNIDNFVNEDIVEKLQTSIFSEEIINVKLKQLCFEKKIDCILNKESIPGDDLIPNIIDFNPYDSKNKYNDYINNGIQEGNEIKDFPMPDNIKDSNIDNSNIQDSFWQRDKQHDTKTVYTQIMSEINGLFSKTKVTQIFTNPLDNPLELKIYILKRENIIFSSFDCQIGNSIKVRSKVIKEEKATGKYEDAIASGNAGIFVSYDPFDNTKIIIHMGNIPPKSEIIFTSNFISPIETSINRYEFEFFRNLPIFQGEEEIYQNAELKGEITIKSNNEIINIQKELLMKDLIILGEQFSEDGYSCTLRYKIDSLPSFSWSNLNYIPSSKLYFDLDTNQPLALVQEPIKEFNEKYYFVQHRFKLDQINYKEKDEISPSLFIFLIDQSISMAGKNMKIASKALLLFLQSIPVGSYYQRIGFGSKFIKYDKTPKEYNKDNIKESISIIKKLSPTLGNTNIYEPLRDIFESNDYNNINLPKNIFLLTDGEVEDKNKVLNLIEANNTKFTIFSIGIGYLFDEDLIKNAGIIGKGSYNFCKDVNKLCSIIVSELYKCCNPFITDIKLNCNLENNNIINNNIPNIIRLNEKINLYYINAGNINNHINIEMIYKDNKNNSYEKNYEITPEQLSKGDELSKLIIYNYIINNNKLSKEEKVKLALKYQLFIEGTSLYAEVELDGKITSEMKLKIIEEKQNKAKNNSSSFNYHSNRNNDDMDRQCLFTKEFGLDDDRYYWEHYNQPETEREELDIKFYSYPKVEEEVKDDFMEMIFTQDFVEGYWEKNDYTKKIMERYEEEYKLIKGYKNKTLDDKTVITILIIYYINLEHPQSLDDLILIIRKAKMFIGKSTNDSFETIINELNINYF